MAKLRIFDQDFHVSQRVFSYEQALAPFFFIAQAKKITYLFQLVIVCILKQHFFNWSTIHEITKVEMKKQ